jgi:glutaredoxin
MFGEDDLQGKIVIFTTLGCPYSGQLKNIFKNKNIIASEIQISNYPVGFMAVDKMINRGSPHLSLPRVFSDGVYIGVSYSMIYLFIYFLLLLFGYPSFLLKDLN